MELPQAIANLAQAVVDTEAPGAGYPPGWLEYPPLVSPKTEEGSGVAWALCLGLWAPYP